MADSLADDLRGGIQFPAFQGEERASVQGEAKGRVFAESAGPAHAQIEHLPGLAETSAVGEGAPEFRRAGGLVPLVAMAAVQAGRLLEQRDGLLQVSLCPAGEPQPVQPSGMEKGGPELMPQADGFSGQLSLMVQVGLGTRE